MNDQETPTSGPATLPADISRCWRYSGYHVYGAGPCFDTLKQATAYKESLDKEGVKWRPQR